MLSERLDPQPGVQLLLRSMKQSVCFESSRVKDHVVWDRSCLWGNSGQMTNDGRHFLMPGEGETLGPWPSPSSMEGARREPVLSESQISSQLGGRGSLS